ncbi:hypothetical protein AM493_16130 [Flavobacterium akiainvivens]|uniref:Secretion system C-terminal sorting domain-containing protein n=1 Tax=Flavobacterium akiainvivens TaxID=1202724 RepID=A0A0N0RQY9_9FLAO|nr:choice-of-anchor L domain-containing protein [Flavobacterium akiainvivens]KOS07399.1 hypothetical protein AM493_16130 [Flavobacterium akiainvivens]SFQ47680.1 Por secretion system C-terminal sorting domain-containing protein [Flavobacterium akiainvivens]
MKKNYLTVLLGFIVFYGFSQPGNDDCSSAVALTVSQDINCTATTNGTVLNATASGGATTCGGSADDDVWYTFTAIYDRASITVNNLSSLTSTMQYELYEGSCSGPVVFCATTYNNTFTATVTPETNYYIRLYTVTTAANPPVDTDFSICIVTPPPGISVSTTQYTAQQLVQDIFAAQPGLGITNITASTGSSNNAAGPNGIGYFSQTNTMFPFEDGIVLSTGSAKAAEGPNGNIQSAGTATWGGDADLAAILLTYPDVGSGFNAQNATSLEFDFVGGTAPLTFSFLYASEEYGAFQCDYGDAFAILLTNTETDEVTNLAIVPGTNLPISSYTVRNGAYNSACAGANVSYFGTFHQPGVVDGPMNFNGRTTPFFVDHPVMEGVTYHLKFVIADRTDPQFDSAIFLNGGSFNIGDSVPPDDTIIISPLPPYVLCDADNDGFALFDLAGVYSPLVTAATQGPGNYSITYYESFEDAQNGDNVLSINTGYTNNLALEQTLYVRVNSMINLDMYDIEEFVIKAVPSPIYEDNLPAIATCANSAINLTVNANSLWNINLYDVTYHLTEEHAEAGLNGIEQPETFVPQAGATFVWVRITDPETGCYEVLLQPLQDWAQLIQIQVEGTTAGVIVNDAFSYTYALNGVATQQTTFTLPDLNYCSNTLTVTNTTCNTTTDLFFDIYPPAPTGESPQTFTQGQTVASLEVEGTGISWFTAAMGGTFLGMDTPLTDGTTYYAAQYIDNCAGIERLPVTVHLVSGLEGNSMATLRCYPNPVKDELKLEHTTTLLSATLYNTLGQQVQHTAINNTQATINLTGVANGIYLLKVQAETGEKVIKVVKE